MGPAPSGFQPAIELWQVKRAHYRRGAQGPRSLHGVGRVPERNGT